MNNQSKELIEKLVDTLEDISTPIPPLHALIKTIRLFHGYREYRLAKKLESLFKGLGDLSKLESNTETLSALAVNGSMERFYEMIISIIDNCDEEQKAEIIGYIIRRIALFDLDHIAGMRMVKLIQRISYYDLLEIMNSDEKKLLANPLSRDTFAGYGLFTTQDSSPWSASGAPTPGYDYSVKYHISTFGSFCIEVLTAYKQSIMD